MTSSSNDISLAVDLGASSGRVLAAKLLDDSIAIEEMHRFSNQPVVVGKRLHWNLLGLWEQIEIGLTKSASIYGRSIRSVGVDTWGVDYVLLDKNDDIVGPAFCYRDSRNQGMMEYAFQKISRDTIFRETGIQFMPINSIYQLASMRYEQSPLLDVAQDFLMIPDFFHWLLSGEKSNEATNASTTQLLRAGDQRWSQKVLSALDIPSHLFRDCIPSGTLLGPIRSDVASRTGLSSVQTIVPATHDTGAAVLAVPASEFAADRPSWGYISCGTWSLMGVELARPNLSDRCLELNFTNEGGVLGSTRLLKNISGLWPFQQCRLAWQRVGKNYSWEEIAVQAEESKPFQSLFDPDDPSLVAPENMVNAIQTLFRRQGEDVLDDVGSIARSTLESLVMRYRVCLGWLEELLGYQLTTIHIVGGGCKNELLCQMTADALQRHIVAGPVEATAIGNLISQALGNGRFSNVSQARHLLQRDPQLRHYEPCDPIPWDDAFQRFQDRIMMRR